MTFKCGHKKRKHNLMLFSVSSISSVSHLLPIIQVKAYVNKHTDIIQVSDESNIEIYITKGHFNAKRSVKRADDQV
jgi:3-deoxy-D-manno-octulosonic acid (KDO) 8-phosphate synthase